MSRQDLLASTLEHVIDSKTDVLWRKNAFVEECKRAGGVEKYQGGSRIDRIVAVEDPHAITNVGPNGMRALSLTTGDTIQRATYEAQRLVKPIVISNKLLDENNGPAAVVNAAGKRTEIGLEKFIRDLNRQFLVGTADATSELATLHTLNGQIVGGPSGDGFLEPVARGAQTNTVGGLNKGVLDEGWKNAFGDANGAFGTDGLNAMHDIWTEVAAYGQSAGKKYIVTSLAAFRNYKQTLFNQERYIDQKSLDGGVMRLLYDGAPICLDPAMDFSGFDTEISMYFLDADAVKLMILRDNMFKLDSFVQHPEYDAKIARIVWHGQLIADALAPCGVLIDGDAF